MSILDLFILAVGLSMDAFAVSVCKGLSLGKIKPKHMCIAGAWFGGFQALMPLIGYFLGSFFAEMIEKYDHWVAFCSPCDYRRKYDKKSLLTKTKKSILQWM